ncbi:unnamed protein product [Arabidopsis halleri]
MQYYENREKDYYEVAQGQRNGYGQSQGHEGYGQSQSRGGYGQSQGHEGYGQSQSRGGYGQIQNREGYSQSQSRPVYGQSPTLNNRSHGGFLDGLFKGQNGQKGQSGLGTFLGQRKSQEDNKGQGHGKLLGQNQKTTYETNKGLNGLGMFINNGEKKKNRRQSEHKKKNKDGHGSGNESGSNSGSDSD